MTAPRGIKLDEDVGKLLSNAWEVVISQDKNVVLFCIACSEGYHEGDENDFVHLSKDTQLLYVSKNIYSILNN